MPRWGLLRSIHSQKTTDVQTYMGDIVYIFSYIYTVYLLNERWAKSEAFTSWACRIPNPCPKKWFAAVCVCVCARGGLIFVVCMISLAFSRNRRLHFSSRTCVLGSVLFVCQPTNWLTDWPETKAKRAKSPNCGKVPKAGASGRILLVPTSRLHDVLIELVCMMPKKKLKNKRNEQTITRRYNFQVLRGFRNDPWLVKIVSS